nr:MAG TPA: hypothetical protein [Caudoviricetes sp.]
MSELVMRKFRSFRISRKRAIEIASALLLAFIFGWAAR